MRHKFYPIDPDKKETMPRGLYCKHLGCRKFLPGIGPGDYESRFFTFRGDTTGPSRDTVVSWFCPPGDEIQERSEKILSQLEEAKKKATVRAKIDEWVERIVKFKSIVATFDTRQDCCLKKHRDQVQRIEQAIGWRSSSQRPRLSEEERDIARRIARRNIPVSIQLVQQYVQPP